MWACKELQTWIWEHQWFYRKRIEKVTHKDENNHCINAGCKKVRRELQGACGWTCLVSRPTMTTSTVSFERRAPSLYSKEDIRLSSKNDTASQKHELGLIMPARCRIIVEKIKSRQSNVEQDKLEE
jgi:hypothetical protein